MSVPRLRDLLPVWLCRVLGHLMVVIGIIGAFVPLLPTVPFLLLALWFYSRGAPHLHERLRSHPRWGKLITAWEQEGIIPLRAKVLAIFMIGIATVYFVYAAPLIVVKVGMIVVAGCVCGFILSRPSRPSS